MNLQNYAQCYNNDLSINDNCTQLLSNHKKTLDHVRKVTHTGIIIANQYGLDQGKVEIACMLHDISAIIPKTKYIDICLDYDIEVLEVERKLPMLLHQKVSRLIAQEIFNIQDKEILNAIESHTTLNKQPSMIDMAVFIADKLSWDQEGTPPFYDLVSIALDTSLEQSCLEYINYCLDNDMILIPHPALLEALEYLEKRKNQR